MKKNIWIMNHYATNMFQEKAGRHYWFSKCLLEEGYKPTIFCASTIHNSDKQIKMSKAKFLTKIVDNIPFVFVKTTPYSGNGLKRIMNMICFYKNLFSVTKKYAKRYGKPDVILASSVHPLTLVAGIKIAKKFGVQCICEVRDLWPESIVEYGNLKRNSIIAKILYKGEKWIYEKADKLIFTMEGGKDYIINQKWDIEHHGLIDTKKVYHINNGIDIELYDNNKKMNVINDEDLVDVQNFKVIYTGSIRHVNKVEKILDVAKILSNYNIKFLLWGAGDQVDILKKRVEDEKINNVVFKGFVDKKYIPYITSNADLNIILGENSFLFQYGGSLNKMFDYFASGKPLLSTFTMGYSLIDSYKAGIELTDSSSVSIADNILYFANLDEETYNDYCDNAHRAARDYDFRNLTLKLINIIEM